MDTNTISNELQQVIHGVGFQDANKTIKTNSILRYAHRVISRVNKEEENSEGEKRKKITGKIKVYGLSHKRGNQSDPELSREIFHKIFYMYSDINNKEETKSDLLLTSMSDHKYMSKVSKTIVNSHETHQNEFPFHLITIVSPDLHHIQPRATQVCNCDEIGFEPNSKWHEFVCAYKFFQGEIM